MNKRIVSIIRKLSDSDRRISIAALADEFAVSQRTVRNDLNAVNDILKEHHLDTLELERGGMILRKKNFSEILAYVDEQDFYDYKLSKEERKKIASVLLVTSSGFITLSDIADHMAVSRATVINDLDEIKAYMKGGNLEVQSHPNKGLCVEGTERNRRLFLLRLVSVFPDMASEDIVQKQFTIEEYVKQVLSRILSEQEQVHESILRDSSFKKMVIYLEIMINRILRGLYVESECTHKNDKYEMARDILNLLEQYCHVHVTQDEIQFFSELLSAEKYRKQKNSGADALKIQMAVRQFIEQVSSELGMNLNRDYDFFENLSNHLENSLFLKHADLEQNSVIQKLVQENESVKYVVEKHRDILEEYAKRLLTETEIGYITIHVCAAIERKKNMEISFQVIVACHAGIGTSHLLQEKLKKYFNFQIVDIVSSHEASSLKKGQADFVISTVPLADCELESIIVSPLLDDEDYIRIGNLVERLREDKERPMRKENRKRTAKELMKKLAPLVYDKAGEQARELLEQIGMVVFEYFEEAGGPDEEIYTPCLYQLLPPSHIQLDVDCRDWRNAVYASAKNLLQLNYIEPRYIDAMIQNIEENGAYIVISKGFALPHEGVDQGVKKLGMNLIRLSKPVTFDAEDRDPVEFVCCLCAADHKTHLKAFFHLVNMLKNESWKDELRNCRTSEEAAEIIKRYECLMESE